MTARYQVLSSVENESFRLATEKKLLLAGDSIFASMNPITPHGFIEQTPREAAAGFFAHFRKNVPKMYVSVDERLFQFPKTRFAFAIEGYLSWGLKERQKGTKVLFGGAESESSTNISILIFSDGQLIELDEKVLPGKTATFYRDALMEMIAEVKIKYPTAHLVQAAPLESWGIQDIEFIGNKALRGINFRRLIRGYNPKTALILPVAITGFGLASYAIAATIGWNAYSSALENYEQAVADPSVTARGGIDPGYLDTMNARRIFMEEPRRQTLLADKAADIVKGIGSVSNVQILELKLPAPSINPEQQVGISVNPNQVAQRQQISPDRTPDIWFAIAVPRTSDSAINQARAVMTTIASHTAMSLRLSHQGWKDDHDRRVFNIEGFIHD